MRARRACIGAPLGAAALAAGVAGTVAGAALDRAPFGAGVVVTGGGTDPRDPPSALADRADESGERADNAESALSLGGAASPVNVARPWPAGAVVAAGVTLALAMYAAMPNAAAIASTIAGIATRRSGAGSVSSTLGCGRAVDFASARVSGAPATRAARETGVPSATCVAGRGAGATDTSTRTGSPAVASVSGALMGVGGGTAGGLGVSIRFASLGGVISGGEACGRAVGATAGEIGRRSRAVLRSGAAPMSARRLRPGGGTRTGRALRDGSLSSITDRFPLHEHPADDARSSRTCDRCDCHSAGSIPAASTSRNSRSTGARARNLSAGNPPGTERWRRHRSEVASSISAVADVSSVMPWRCSDAKNPAGVKRALMDASLALGQSPTNVTSNVFP